MEYNFDDLYKDATMLTQDFLRNEMDYTPRADNQKALFKNYYNRICAFVRQNNAYRLSPSQIEEFLENGHCACYCNYGSPIKTATERRYLFLRAMGSQLIYEDNNGVVSMISGTDSENDFCRDAKEYLSMIGLMQSIRWL